MKNDLHKEYMNYAENAVTQPPKEVKESYTNMCDDFESYIGGLQEYMWIQGFNYAMSLKKGDKS